MANLKNEHPYLYRRVRLKAILFLIFGISIMFLDPATSQAARRTVIPSHVGTFILGAIFFLVGVAIAIGLFRSRHTYRMARVSLYIATGYAIFWFLAFVLSFISGKLQSTFFISLWGYLTYNLFYITSDPAWTTVSVIQAVDEHNDGLLKRQ